MTRLSYCEVCGERFNAGDRLQAYLRSPDDPGSWTEPVVVDDDYQVRFMRAPDKIPRKHVMCDVPKDRESGAF